MDALLARIGYQALNMAMRSGIAITSTYAISQCSRLMKKVDDKDILDDLRKLQEQLNSKIKVLSPAIDLIEFRSGRGNAFLESAVPLAKALHRDITLLGRELEDAAASIGDRRQHNAQDAPGEAQQDRLKRIVLEIKDLLTRIDRDIPLIHMAITASGESLTSSLSPGISPSRLMQASAFLFFGDTLYATHPAQPVQIGPAFTLSLYMLFRGHADQPSDAKWNTPREAGGTAATAATAVSSSPTSTAKQPVEPYGIEEADRKPLWQEVVHKARVRVCRTPCNFVFNQTCGYVPGARVDPNSGWGDPFGAGPATPNHPESFAYHLEIVEDLDDGRVHDEEAQKSPSFDDVRRAGIRESIPIYQIAKIFYADTGRILNIGNDGEESNPVLLLKRDVNAMSPLEIRRQMTTEHDSTDPGQDGSRDEPTSDDEQGDIDRQLRQESRGLEDENDGFMPDFTDERTCWSLPGHLDPEWLALEVFEDDEDDDDDGSDEEESEGAMEHTGAVNSSDSGFPDEVQGGFTTPERQSHRPRERSSLDARLIEQIKGLSVQSTPIRNLQPTTRPVSSRAHTEMQQRGPNLQSTTTRSPFGAVATSLSLMEMLIRLTSLQEFQQASHLTIHDHVLNFFLEETSTAGLSGEEGWKTRNKAKQRVGFDPYSDMVAK